MTPFALRTPRTLAEATALLALPQTRALAGGTDLVPNLCRGLGQPATLIDVTAIPDLARITHTPARTTIGAAVTLAGLAADAHVRGTLPALVDAARSVAGPAHRSVATLGGNLCQDTRCVFYNQSEWWRRANAYCLKHGGETCHVAPHGRRCHAAFASDVAPVLLALDATVVTAAPGGGREFPLAELYVDDGAAHLALRNGEWLVAVKVPSSSTNARVGYRKIRARGAIDFPLAGAAVRIEMREARIADLRVALTGTNSRAFLLEGTGALVGRPLDDDALATLGKLVRKQASPMRTTVTQSNYRRQAAAAVVQRLVRELGLASEGIA